MLVSVASLDLGISAVSVTSFASVIVTFVLVKDMAAVVVAEVAGWLVVVVATGSEGNLF